MKSRTIKIAAVALLLLVAQSSTARKNVNSVNNPKSTEGHKVLAADCFPTTAQKDLDFNNIRTTILVGSDMFWDLVNGKYEVPKDGGKHSMFAGALWIGGFDDGGQLKVAAQTYRQTGNDFWGGPIQLGSLSITQDRCLDFDRHWRLRKEDVLKWSKEPGFEAKTPEETDSRLDIIGWPGNGGPGEDPFLAPYEDVNGNLTYDPDNGDYPRYKFTGDYPMFSPDIPKVVCNDYLFGDQTIWWVFNDVGNTHTESESEEVIGLEVRAQAFAFKTNDEINEMTFYKYQIINRSSSTLNDTYFGQWMDPDLGEYSDDYVGCDVKLGLGFVYNGDSEDQGAAGYGFNPPALGVDFFQGPNADVGDLIDNDRDGCTDCSYLINIATGDTTTIVDSLLPEQIIMAKFVYYRNDGTVQGNPDELEDYYGYLNGYWKDNLPITWGNTGYNVGSTDYTNFMFPGTSDPAHPINWDMASAGVVPADMRWLQSAGTFTLQAGAVNHITVGLVWQKTTQGGPYASVELVKAADIKAQALFDNCFKLLDGPNAPDLVIRELDKQLIISLQNTYNLDVELYSAIDPTNIDSTVSVDAKRYKFQGYQVYQVKDQQVTPTDLKNPDKARLAFQCDLKDSISRIINYKYDPFYGTVVPVEEVVGKNAGITHTFKVENDLFATGSSKLVNHKTYFYTAISYAYNNYKTFVPDSAYLGGQELPYLAGRNNIRTYTAIPHIITLENNGTVLNSEYGDGPVIRRIEGQGNGGMVLDFTQSTIDEILNSPNHRSLEPEYIGGHGPIDVKVYDPFQVKALNFTNKFNGLIDTSRWTMIESTTNTTVVADTTINQINEQVFSVDYKHLNGNGEIEPLTLDWGISANIHTVIEPGKTGAINNGFLEASIKYNDNSQRWITFLPDFSADLTSPENWISSNAGLGDATGVYEKVLSGTWAPVKVCNSASQFGPKPVSSWLADAQMSLSPTEPPSATSSKTSIASVDIVFTSDMSKWTRAAVLEMHNDTSVSAGHAFRFDLRREKSADKFGNLGGDISISDSGMSWFPGYALNLETGERLNIAFGENSTMTADNGADMKWNPSDRKKDGEFGSYIFGGMHYVYIFGHNEDGVGAVPLYDSCKYIFNKLDSAGKGLGSGPTAPSANRRAVYKDAMWTCIPMLTTGRTLLGTDLTVRLRVARNYRQYNKNIINTYLNNSNALTTGQLYYVVSGPVIYDALTYQWGSFFTAGSITGFTGSGLVTPVQNQNGANPMYTFGTGSLAPSLNNLEAAKDALDLINVVPNPYYAYSAYEGQLTAAGTSVTGQLDNRIKIVNLPPRCKVSIFTMNGVLIKRFIREAAADNSLGGDIQRGNDVTSIDWDLKNTDGLTISSGIYLIHVEAEGLGERTLKWFGMLRPVDLDTF